MKGYWSIFLCDLYLLAIWMMYSWCLQTNLSTSRNSREWDSTQTEKETNCMTTCCSIHVEKDADAINDWLGTVLASFFSIDRATNNQLTDSSHGAAEKQSMAQQALDTLWWENTFWFCMFVKTHGQHLVMLCQGSVTPSVWSSAHTTCADLDRGQTDN